MASPIRVVGFAGSLRKQSYNRALLRAALELLPEGMELEMHPEVMATNAAERFDQQGQLSDERTRKQVTELFVALKELVDIIRKSSKEDLAQMT